MQWAVDGNSVISNWVMLGGGYVDHAANFIGHGRGGLSVRSYILDDERSLVS